jgi:8-hydroxy-5-deazaflavin:NADPH oxidoreductase
VANVTILGNGNMGKAISSVLTKGGSSVQVLDQADSGTPVSGDIVVLAVPYAALSGIAADRGGELSGKVVVDITNPVNFQTFDSLVVPADSSAAAELAVQLPQSRVVKAFNTTFASTLARGTVGPHTTTVLVAGDDAQAKSALIEAVSAAGLNAVDTGSLARARELEAFGFLQLSLAAADKTSWGGGFALIA